MSQENNPIKNTPESIKKQTRKEYMANYYAKNKEQISAQRKAARLAKRDELNAAAKEKYATDPVYWERRIKTDAIGKQNKRERIATDPAAKQRHEEYLAMRRKRHKERLANDPEYRKQREKHTAALREKRRKQKTEGDEQ